MSSPSKSTSSSSSSLTQSIEFSSRRLSNEDVFQNNLNDNDDNEILKLVNLLILRVECLANENILINRDKNKTYPTIKQIDQNLIEYLYYLFSKFIKDDNDLNTPMIDKSNFVNVCQTLVRNGCFNIPLSTSPDQSFSEPTLTNNSDLTLNQTFVHEYRSDTDNVSLEKSSLNEQITSTPTNEQETWLVVDIEPIQSQYLATTPDESKVRSFFYKENTAVFS
jgi:hypothetical protein